MTRYRATVAYDGTAYAGFQRQAPGTPTVQGALEAALATLNGGAAVTVIGSGRTDAGVHAIGQVVAFDLDWSHGPDALLNALNHHLPADVAVRDLAATRDDFHPRFAAFSRTYQYRVLVAAQRQPLDRTQAWWLRGPLDVEAMQVAADLFIGPQDFGALGTPPQGDNTVRTVYRSFWEHQPDAVGQRLVYTMEANAFLYHMVRRSVGLLVEVGLGRLSSTDLEALLRRADLVPGVTLAPPHGLVLVRVRYAEDDDALLT